MRIVVKVGTSTLAHATGRLNIRHAEVLQNTCQPEVVLTMIGR